MGQHLEEFDQGHRRSSRDTSHQNHLQPPDQALADVPPPAPAAHEAGLAVAEHEQGDCHGGDGPAQRDEGIVWADEEVWEEGHEAADEVAQCDG